MDDSLLCRMENSIYHQEIRQPTKTKMTSRIAPSFQIWIFANTSTSDQTKSL